MPPAVLKPSVMTAPERVAEVSTGWLQAPEKARWSPALDVNTGEAAIYAPMDAGFPTDGIVAATRGDEDWAIADIDLPALEDARAAAQVANDRDWRGQLQPAIAVARVESLG